MAGGVVPSLALASRRRGRSTHIISIGVALMAMGLAIAALLDQEQRKHQSVPGPGRSLPAAAPPSPVDGGLTPDRRAALAYLTRYTNDPASLEVVEWGDVSPCRQIADGYGSPCDRAMPLLVRARNDFGAPVTDAVIVYFQGPQVVRALDRQSADATSFYLQMQQFRRSPQ